jgi:hypothetical protein
LGDRITNIDFLLIGAITILIYDLNSPSNVPSYSANNNETEYVEEEDYEVNEPEPEPEPVPPTDPEFEDIWEGLDRISACSSSGGALKNQILKNNKVIGTMVRIKYSMDYNNYTI